MAKTEDFLKNLTDTIDVLNSSAGIRSLLSLLIYLFFFIKGPINLKHIL